MGLCSHHDPITRSISPLLRAEDLYLAQYNATRRRSVDTGGLALALRDDGSLERTSGKGWGGWDDSQQASIPYAEMLSRLYMQTMPSSCLQSDASTQHIPSTTRLRLIRSTGSWAFDPLSLSENDLFDTTCLIFDVVFTIEGASEDIGIQAHQLRPFLQAMRSVYSQHNTYHNYQHAVDVLQAMYAFLADAGCVPPISILEGSRALVSPKWKRASAPAGTLKAILSNIDVFMLFVAALGHDAGHPGLNNGFMKYAGTCLSAIFDHTSTLERMHCTLLLQLMRNFGLGHLIRSDNIIFGDSIASSVGFRGALVDTVLATDMSLHFRWIKDFNDLLDERVPLDTAFDIQNEKAKRRVKILACQALMKCADISNPVRPHTISEAWSRALMNEWYAQATLERSMALPTSVPSNVPPPTRPSIFAPEDPRTSPHQCPTTPPAYEDQLEHWDSTEIIAAKEQVKVQVGFIDIFTCPLYAALARFAPELGHFYARCTQNRQLWEAKMGELTELQAELQHAADADMTTDPGVLSHRAEQPLPQTPSALASERDTRSSIDSAQPLFSPGLMSNFSFGRRASTTTTASSASSVQSGGEEQSNAEGSGSTPKGKNVAYFPSSWRDSAGEASTSHDYHPPPSSFQPLRHIRNSSIASSVSGVSSYYTARSAAASTDSNHDPTSWATSVASVIPLLDRENASDGWYLSPRTQGIVAFAAHVGLPTSPGVSYFGGSPNDHTQSISPSEPEYRAPLGIESMRAAYRANARRHVGTYEFGVSGLRDGGLIDREYSYRRRSAGSVGPYVRPLAVR